MAENKKHHYVPRFYLKRFSRNGKSINLYNLKSGRAILHANLKNQCYRNYFYGENLAIERALADIEGETARIFTLIDQFGRLPPLRSSIHFHIVLYILMQYARTAYSAEAVNEMSDKVMKHLLGPKAKAKGIDLSKVTIGIKDPAAYSLGLAMQAYPLLLDLRYKLLINKTGEDFVTSDNPAVFYNQYFDFRRFGGNAGIASKGLQIFFPLDHEKMMLMYDADVYGVGSNKDDVVEITTLQDVYGLNTLQVCSASENIYFRSTELNSRALHKKAAPFLRNRKTNFQVFPQEETATSRRELIATSREDIRTDLSLSFLRIRKSAKRWRESFRKLKLQPAVSLRNEQLYKVHKEYRDLVKSGESKSEDFFAFLDKKYGQRANDLLYGTSSVKTHEPNH